MCVIVYNDNDVTRIFAIHQIHVNGVRREQSHVFEGRSATTQNGNRRELNHIEFERPDATQNHQYVNARDWVFGDGHFSATDQVWRPSGGCDVHNYTRRDIRQCLRQRALVTKQDTNIYCIGDSRVRYHLYYIVALVTGEFLDPMIHRDNRTFSYPRLHFSATYMASMARHHRRDETYSKLLDKMDKHEIAAPSVILTGGALHTLSHYNDSIESIAASREALVHLLPLLNQLGERSDVIWMLQEPIYREARKGGSLRRNYLIHQINHDDIDILQSSAKSGLVHLWRNLGDITRLFEDPATDGVHFKGHVITMQDQLLFNFLCNDYMDFGDQFCSSSKFK